MVQYTMPSVAEPDLIQVNCYSYNRISSSSRRQKEGDGIPRQLRLSHKFAEQKGWVMNTDFRLIDIGKSAFHGRNLDDQAALGQFINALECGLINKPAILLVENLDRISRDVIPKAIQLFLTIINYGVSICTHSDGQIYSEERVRKDSSALMIAITYMARAHEESAVKSMRIKESWNDSVEKLRSGNITKKPIYPKWINVVDNKLEVDQEAANIIRDLFDKCINKNMSYPDLNRHLRESGLADKIKRKREKSKTNTTTNHLISRLFKGYQVLGYYEPHHIIEIGGSKKRVPTGEKIKAYPAIISEDVYFQARAAIEERKTSCVGQPAKRTPNFFKNILKCSCGGAYTLTCSGKKSRFVCHNKYAHKNYCQMSASLLSDKMQTILFHTMSLISEDDFLQSSSIRKRTKLTDEINQKTAEIKDKENRVDNLSELIEGGSKIGVKRMLELESEIKQIKHNLVEIHSVLKSLDSPNMTLNLDRINNFNKEYVLQKISREESLPINRSLRNIIETIIVRQTRDSCKAGLKITLFSGVIIDILVHSDYSADIYKNKKRISRLEAG